MQYLKVKYNSLGRNAFFEELDGTTATTAFIVIGRTDKIKGVILYNYTKDLLTFAELGVAASVTYGTIDREELLQKALLPNQNKNFFDFMRKALGKSKNRVSRRVFETIYDVNFDQPDIPNPN